MCSCQCVSYQAVQRGAGSLPWKLVEAPRRTTLTPRTPRRDAPRRAKDAPTPGRVDAAFLRPFFLLFVPRYRRVPRVSKIPTVITVLADKTVGDVCTIGDARKNEAKKSGRERERERVRERNSRWYPGSRKSIGISPTRVQPLLATSTTATSFLSRKRFAERSQAGCLRR